MQWTEELVAAYKNFPFAPPDYPGAPYRPRPPDPPYTGAPGWQCSIYYYWWEYLRRHNGYRQTCETGVPGEHALLYKYFGDVHATDFHTWWWKYMWLFTFVSEALQMGAPTRRREYPLSEGLFLHVGFSRSRTAMVSSVRDLFKSIEPQDMEVEIRKLYRCYPMGRPRLRSLHEHLAVWDARNNNPDADQADLADIAGLTGLERYPKHVIAELQVAGDFVGDLDRANRRAKQLAVQRHLRIAEQYIHNVAQADFPMRSGR
jgi:hypothetical protein